MEKWINRLGWAFTVVCCVFLAWFLVSWVDIAADNCQPNPVHNSYNLFVLLCDEDEPKAEPEMDGQCGDPLSVFDVTTGYIQQKSDNKVWFVAENGNTYVTEVGNVENFALEGYYTLMLDGDQVVKAFVEVW